ncbi:hypothetical protein G6F66_015289 [Rhizopus arrhizus]|nr:hypothetical protein G6F66_015289 [Rhizopus arrhizus]
MPAASPRNRRSTRRSSGSWVKHPAPSASAMRWRAPGNHRAADNAVAGGRRGQRSTSSQSARLNTQHPQAAAS